MRQKYRRLRLTFEIVRVRQSAMCQQSFLYHMPLTLYKTFAWQTFASLHLFTCLVYFSTYCVPIAHLGQNKPFPLLYLTHAQNNKTTPPDQSPRGLETKRQQSVLRAERIIEHYHPTISYLKVILFFKISAFSCSQDFFQLLLQTAKKDKQTSQKQIFKYKTQNNHIPQNYRKRRNYFSQSLSTLGQVLYLQLQIHKFKTIYCLQTWPLDSVHSPLHPGVFLSLVFMQ